MSRVALFTPLPPARTGTADYAAELIPALNKRVHLDVFESVPRSLRLDRYDLSVFEIANNPYHASCYELAIRHPGVAVLHETNLHHLIRGLTLQTADEKAYVREVIYEIFGREFPGTPNGLFNIEVPQPQHFTMLRRVLEQSLGCIVHSSWAETEIRRRGYRRPVAVIPHGATLRNPDGMRQRDLLGISTGDFVVGCFGYIRPTKRVLEFLRVFRQLRDILPGAMLVVAGQSHPEVPVEQELARLALRDSVRLLEFQEKIEDFDRCLAACDVVFNLRYPSFGESSGVTMRAFGMGKPVVLSDEGSSRELPDEICIKIPVDQYEGAVLLRCLRWLAENSEVRRAVGENARRWVERNCTWDRVADLHARFFHEVAEQELAPKRDSGTSRHEASEGRSLRDFLFEWVEPESDREEYLKRHISRLERTISLVPPAGRHDSLLEMGCYLHITPALRDILNYGEIRGSYLGPAGTQDQKTIRSRGGESFKCAIDLFNAEIDRFPYPDEDFSVVLCAELLEHLQVDPMHMLREIHRVLKPDGRLVLTTPNAVSSRSVLAVLRGEHPGFYSAYQLPHLAASEPRHGREYTPAEILQLLSDAGFLVQRIETGAYSGEPLPEAADMAALLSKYHFPADLRGECIFAVGQKGPNPGSRFPSWLYQTE